jgi:hypothetical protein
MKTSMKPLKITKFNSESIKKSSLMRASLRAMNLSQKMLCKTTKSSFSNTTKRRI